MFCVMFAGYVSSLLGIIWCGKLGSWFFDLFRTSFSLCRLELATLSKLGVLFYLYSSLVCRVKQ